jgi:hypothetical protein
MGERNGLIPIWRRRKFLLALSSSTLKESNLKISGRAGGDSGEIGVDYQEFEQKKKKTLRWVELAFYVVVVVVVTLKVLPILWRVLMRG